MLFLLRKSGKGRKNHTHFLLLLTLIVIHSFFADGPFPLKFGKIAMGDLPFQRVSERLKSVCLRRIFKIFENEEKNLRQLH